MSIERNEKMKLAVYESKLGFIKIEYENETVTVLQKLCEIPTDFGITTDFTDRVFDEISGYFEGKRKDFTFKISPKGTDFQKKVWSALCDIPYGETRTYKQIATAIGNEKASRAVGMANNKNPLHIVVPCHRVIGASGKLVGYAGGLEMKEYLLNMERENK